MKYEFIKEYECKFEDNILRATSLCVASIGTPSI